MSGIVKNVSRITQHNSTVMICDMQEKFRSFIQHYSDIITNANRILDAAKILKVPVVCTEQYPKGLGPTVPELDIKGRGITPVEKTKFSMLVDGVLKQLDSQKRKSLILCGIESHVCIFHTALDFIEAGYDVHIVVDAVSSRSLVDRKFALKRLQSAGAHLTTTECTVLGLVADSAHPNFKEVQQLVKELGPTAGH